MRFYRTAVRCVCVAAAMVAARGQTQIDLRTQGKNVDFSTAASTRPSKTGTSLPAACMIGETFLKTDAPAGKNLYVCTASGVWTVQGVEVPNTTGKTDQVLSTDGTGLQWQALGGDIGGPPGALTVTSLRGRKLGSAVPLDGQFLRWNSALQQWEATTLAGALSVFGRTGAIAAQTGDYSFPQIAGTIAGWQLPAATGDLSGALPGPTVVKIQGRPISATTPLTGQILGWDGAQWVPQTATTGTGGVTSIFGRTGAVNAQNGDYSFGQIAGSVAAGQLPNAAGDLNGTLTNATVARLQSRPMAATLPGTGQVLAWDGAQWSPQTVSGGGSGGGLDKGVSNTYASGAKQTFVPSGSTSGINVAPGGLPTNAAAGDVAVDSSDANKLKLYDGSQWNTLISLSNYITTFSSATIVTVNGSTHRLGTANLIVDCYDNGSPSSRVEPDRVAIDPLVYNVTIYFASAQTGHCVITGSSGASATGGSGGAGMTSQLGDLGLVQSSATVLTAGLNCSNATPCNFRLGSTVYSVTNSSTITITGGTGTVYLYVDASGALTAGHNVTAACAGVCVAVAGITAFPTGSIPLYTWTASNGAWDANSGNDRRALLSTRNVTGGVGIVTLDTGTQSMVAVDSATVPSYLTATAVLNLASIAPGGCGETTFALPGASPGDSVAAGWPAGLESGLVGIMRVTASGTVAVRVCNLSGTTVDPAAATFRATILRSF